jgi:hypothetical protein
MSRTRKEQTPERSTKRTSPTAGLVEELNRFADAARRLQGWELDHSPEPLADGPAWNYESMARGLAAGSGSILDLGTGGGEVISRVIDGLPCITVATEEWVVNAPVAAGVWHELRAVFPDMTVFPDHFSAYQDGLREAGLVVEYADEFRRPVRFRELGHLVYHLVAAPWLIPDFDVESRLHGLQTLQQQLESGRPLVLTEGYYVIHARRHA